ncbi:sigma-70 family RNA polymerase sigma factor [Nocardia sp. NPDC003482]
MPTDAESRAAIGEFEQHRGKMTAIAYRLLGSASDAEDVVQDAYIRWRQHTGETVRNHDAWLTTVVTNLSINKLNLAYRTRESYLGPWLPEPVITSDPSVMPDQSVEMRETISMAMLVLMEKLSPPERAVFVLREAFGYTHHEISQILGITESGSQQHYRRARLRLKGGQRYTPTGIDAVALARSFLEAARGDDIASFEALLAGEVVSWADGGGRVTAATRPVSGRITVAHYLRSWMAKAPSGIEFLLKEVNCQPAVVAREGHKVIAAILLETHEGLISTIRTCVNPDKLRFLDRQLST